MCTSDSSSSSSTVSGSEGDLHPYVPVEDSSVPDWTSSAVVAAMEQLRAVVGEVSDEALHSLLLAADLDINRAVNYYFGTQD